jgi:hypothetical protein
VEHTYSIVVGQPEGKKSLGRARCIEEGDIKVDLKEILSEVVNVKSQVAGGCEHGDERSSSIHG